MIAMLGAGAGFLLFFLYANLFEYVFHRWIMHRRWRLLPYPWEVHTLLHHEVFGGNATYRVQGEKHRDAILFEWWQAPLLLAVHAPLVWGAQIASGLPLFWGGMGALATYYALYEYLHWCMHNPAGRWLEGTRLFQHLDAHHRLHHGTWRINFNVVFPLADLLFGTFRPASALPQPAARRGGSYGQLGDLP